MEPAGRYCLILTKGLRVPVFNLAPDAAEKLHAHLKEIWPSLERIRFVLGALLSNHTFGGVSLDGHFA